MSPILVSRIESSWSAFSLFRWYQILAYWSLGKVDRFIEVYSDNVSR